MYQISILGCGWLGLPLAKTFIEKGVKVNGSTTSETKIPALENFGINTFLVTLSAVEGLTNENEIDLFLENSKILIINIPPKLRSVSNENFVQKIQNLIPFIEKSSVEKVLFISSTAVYADVDTSTALSVTEETKPNPTTESGKQLLQAEQLLLNNKNFKTTVVRFGGLIGEDRHPIHILAGRKGVENPDAPINLIHQKDCIGIIEEILRYTQNDNLVWNETFNTVAPFHPSRKAYYTQKAIELNLAIPEFDETKPSNGKLISSEKVSSVLKYNFVFSSL